MNIALILSTLVIGASTINSPGDTGQSLSPQFAPPTSALPLPPIMDNSPTQSKTNNSRSALSDAKKRNLQRTPSSRTTRPNSSGRYNQMDDQNKQPMMPISPTDSSAGNQIGQNYQWLPPTANSSSVGSADSAGRPSGMFGPMNVPTSPTRARPGTPQSYASMQTAEQQNRRIQAARNAAATNTQVTTKPFSGYSQPSSGISPYMNLFRTGSNNGTIDNYTTLVKPELDQRRANLKFGSDIHGLENSTHVQGMSIQQLNRDTQNLQGVNATQYFMNYGDYYPGAR